MKRKSGGRELSWEQHIVLVLAVAYEEGTGKVGFYYNDVEEKYGGPLISLVRDGLVLVGKDPGDDYQLAHKIQSALKRKRRL